MNNIPVHNYSAKSYDCNVHARGKHRLISILCQMECEEIKLDVHKHSNFSAHLLVVRNFDIKFFKYCCY